MKAGITSSVICKQVSGLLYEILSKTSDVSEKYDFQITKHVDERSMVVSQNRIELDLTELAKLAVRKTFRGGDAGVGGFVKADGRWRADIRYNGIVVAEIVVTTLSPTRTGIQVRLPKPERVAHGHKKSN